MGNIEIFDRIAGQYDSESRVHLAHIIANAIREQLVLPAKKTAMDFGCGTGLIGMALLQDFASVLFLDASANMIQQVQIKIRDANVKNASALCCDLTGGCSLTVQVDCIFMVQTLLHIHDTKQILTRLHELLCPNGRLFLVDYNETPAVTAREIHPGFNQQNLCNLLTEIGFSQATSKTFYHGKNLLMNQDASLFLLEAVK